MNSIYQSWVQSVEKGWKTWLLKSKRGGSTTWEIITAIFQPLGSISCLGLVFVCKSRHPANSETLTIHRASLTTNWPIWRGVGSIGPMRNRCRYYWVDVWPNQRSPREVETKVVELTVEVICSHNFRDESGKCWTFCLFLARTLNLKIDIISKHVAQIRSNH